jgi:hypothetical protein
MVANLQEQKEWLEQLKRSRDFPVYQPVNGLLASPPDNPKGVQSVHRATDTVTGESLRRIFFSAWATSLFAGRSTIQAYEREPWMAITAQ